MERRSEPRPVTPPAVVEPPPVIAPTVAPPVAATSPRTSKAWTIGIPIAIVVLIGIIWAVVAGMPFGGQHQQSQQSNQIRPADRPAVDTIAEGTSTAATSSIGDTTDMQSQQPAVPPPMTSVAPPPAAVPQPMPATTPPSSAAPSNQPVPTTTTQPVAPPRTQTQISETEARAILARYLDARDPYHTPGDCMVVRGSGFVNRGYGFDVFDHCQNQRLGSWRVDAVTRELFEQKPDGRYLRP
jgi:hypothetical protein